MIRRGWCGFEVGDFGNILKNRKNVSAGMSNKYLSLTDDNMISANSENIDEFEIMLSKQSKMIIKASNGKFIVGEQNGLFRAIGSQEKATLWSY